jgi:hypothetical protein
MNEIKENSYAMNVLRKGNIVCCRYWKTILFIRFWVTSILDDHETSCVGKLMSLSFHAYEERLN